MFRVIFRPAGRVHVAFVRGYVVMLSKMVKYWKRGNILNYTGLPRIYSYNRDGWNIQVLLETDAQFNIHLKTLTFWKKFVLFRLGQNWRVRESHSCLYERHALCRYREYNMRTTSAWCHECLARCEYRGLPLAVHDFTVWTSLGLVLGVWPGNNTRQTCYEFVTSHPEDYGNLVIQSLRFS